MQSFFVFLIVCSIINRYCVVNSIMSIVSYISIKSNMCLWSTKKNSVRLNTVKQTRKHSSRMRTACLPTVRAFVTMPPDVSTSGGRGGSSSEHFWTGLQWWLPDVTSRRAPRVPCLMSWKWGGGIGGVCSVRSNISWVMAHGDPLPAVDRQTDRHTQLNTLPSRNFVGGW